jgi:hypothetical protein
VAGATDVEPILELSMTRTLFPMSLVALAGLAVPAGVLAQSSANSSDEVRAIVAEAMADSQSRSSLLAAGETAGHDKNFFIASNDGAFRLNVGGMIQFRYYANFRDDNSVAGINPGDDFEGGFQTTRTRLNFTGNIINPDWFYRVEAQFEADGGSFTLLDAFAGYNFGDGWSLQWGQFEFAFSREENINPGKYLAVDQSVVNAVFTQGYSQGAQVKYQDDNWRAFAGFSDGLRTANTDINNPAENDFGVNGRLEYKFGGNWAQFEDFTSPPGSDFGALLGGAVWYQQSANTGAPTDVDLDYLGYTLDLALEGDSWNIFGAFHGRHLESRGPVGNSNTPESDDFGGVLQAGWRFSETDEIFARWDGVFLDQDTVPANSDDNFHFATVGWNHYFAGHAAKFTADVVYSFNQTDGLINSGIGGFPNTGLGLLGSSEDGEAVVRLQFQLLF